MNQLGLAASRAAAAQRTTAPAFEDVARCSDIVLGTPPASFAMRIYVPARDGDGRLPLLMFFHAGGWILGDLNHSDRLCRHLANLAGAVVVNVDYRLSPEHPYPAPLDDCEAAYGWAIAHADDFNIDRDRVGFVGESSGGNLAAALVHRVRRNGGPIPAALLLLAPALDATMQSASWRDLGNLYPPAREQMAWMWDLYLSGRKAADDPEASPASETNFDGHPPTVIVTAGFDPLRDDGERYAEKLERAGVPVRFRCEEPLMHAFANSGGLIPEGLVAFDRAVAEMMRLLVMPHREDPSVVREKD